MNAASIRWSKPSRMIAPIAASATPNASRPIAALRLALPARLGRRACRGRSPPPAARPPRRARTPSSSASTCASEPPLGRQREGRAERRARAGRPGEGEHDPEHRLADQPRSAAGDRAARRRDRESGASARSKPAPKAGTSMISADAEHQKRRNPAHPIGGAEFDAERRRARRRRRRRSARGPPRARAAPADRSRARPRPRSAPAAARRG